MLMVRLSVRAQGSEADLVVGRAHPSQGPAVFSPMCTQSGIGGLSARKSEVDEYGRY